MVNTALEKVENINTKKIRPPITKQARRNVATPARKACEPYLND